MAKRSLITTKEYIKSVPLPTNNGSTYVVLSNSDILDIIYNEFKKLNLTVTNELYYASISGNIVAAKHFVKINDEFNFAFHWTNSYNKMIRFGCHGGINIKNKDAIILTNSTGSFLRKHIGSAKQECTNAIKDQINLLQMYLSKVKALKDIAVNTILSLTDISKLYGEAYLMYNTMTSNQFSKLYDSFMLMKNKPLALAKQITLWDIFIDMLNVIAHTHPKLWVDSHFNTYSVVENYINKHGISNIDPKDNIAGQTSITDASSKVDDLSVLAQNYIISKYGKLAIFDVHENADKSGIIIEFKDKDKKEEISYEELNKLKIEEKPISNEEVPIDSEDIDKDVPIKEDNIEEESVQESELVESNDNVISSIDDITKLTIVDSDNKETINSEDNNQEESIDEITEPIEKDNDMEESKIEESVAIEEKADSSNIEDEKTNIKEDEKEESKATSINDEIEDIDNLEFEF